MGGLNPLLNAKTFFNQFINIFIDSHKKKDIDDPGEYQDTDQSGKTNQNSGFEFHSVLYKFDQKPFHLRDKNFVKTKHASGNRQNRFSIIRLDPFGNPLNFHYGDFLTSSGKRK